jgi:threonine dehydrogenase-like Zn-dependent dehydrogenase
VVLAAALVTARADAEGSSYFQDLSERRRADATAQAPAAFFQARAGHEVAATVTQLDKAAAMDLGLPQYFRGLALAWLLPRVGLSGTGVSAADAGRADQVIAVLEFALAARDQTGQAVAGLVRGGRVVVMGYAAGTETTMRVTDLVWKLAHVSGFSLSAASAEEQAMAYAAVLPLIASGQIAPAHDRSFPLEQARLCGGFSGLLCSLRGPAQEPMKSSIAWLTSWAWVQMMACGPPAMTMEREFFSNAGSLRLVAS